MHLAEHELYAYRDQQMPEAGRATCATHLAECADCRARLTEIETRAERLNARLAALAPRPAEQPRPARAAWAQLKTRALTQGETSMLTRLFSRRLRPLWAGLTLIAVLVAAFSFAPVRAWAGEFLGLFRVQQVTVLPIDTTRLSALGGDEVLAHRLSQMFADSVNVTKEPGAPQVAADAAEASQLAGFTVRLPASRTDTPQLIVQSGTAFEFTVNRERAQALINDLGYGELKLPASLDNAPITVDIPTALTAGYGPCPKPSDEGFEDEDLNAGRRFKDCILFVQMPSPSVNTPPDLDVAQLAQMALRLTGMTEEEAAAYSETVDWASTLVIPIPRNGASYTQVAVDGVLGNLIVRPVDDAPQFALVWVKNGIIYAIGGLGTDPAEALDMANSLQ